MSGLLQSCPQTGAARTWDVPQPPSLDRSVAIQNDLREHLASYTFTCCAPPPRPGSIAATAEQASPALPALQPRTQPSACPARTRPRPAWCHGRGTQSARVWCHRDSHRPATLAGNMGLGPPPAAWRRRLGGGVAEWWRDVVERRERALRSRSPERGRRVYIHICTSYCTLASTMCVCVYVRASMLFFMSLVSRIQIPSLEHMLASLSLIC